MRDLLLPLGFLPLLSPLTLLIALPQVLANLLTNVDWTQNLRVHYAAMPLAAAALAMVEGVARINREALRRFALGLIAAVALATSVAWGVMPWSVEYEGGVWPLFGNHRRATMEAAISFPGPDDAVTATYNLSPHLSHRRQIYTWPNPFRAFHWGTGAESPPDSSIIEWLIVDRNVLGDSAAEFDATLADPAWEVVFDQEGVVVARRTGQNDET